MVLEVVSGAEIPAPDFGQRNTQRGPHRPAGQRSSIAFMISSAHRTASAIALTVAGTLFPPSNRASFRAARIVAAINNTRLRPSSTRAFYHVRFLFAMCIRMHLGGWLEVSMDFCYLLAYSWIRRCFRDNVCIDSTKLVGGFQA